MAKETEQVALFPPRDFVPTSVIWGFWSAAVLAGVNLMRFGDRTRGKWLVVLGLLAQLAVCAGFAGFTLLVSQGQGQPNPQPAMGPDMRIILVPFGWVDLVVVAINIGVAYWLYTTQRQMYKQWQTDHSPVALKSPYLAWWVSVLAIVSTLLLVSLAFAIFG
jgi:hypothetical protein